MKWGRLLELPFLIHMPNYKIGSSYNFGFPAFFHVLCFIKVKLFVPLLCVCAILPAKTIPKMTHTVSGGMLNPTHSLTML